MFHRQAASGALPTPPITLPSAWNSVDVYDLFLNLHDQLDISSNEQIEKWGSACSIYELIKSKNKSPLLSVRFYLDADGIPRIDKHPTQPISYSDEEKFNLAYAFYQMIVALDDKKCDERLSCKISIASLLLKPFYQLFPSPEVLHFVNLYRQHLFRFENRTKRNRPPHIISKDEAAVCLQRAARRRNYHRKKPDRLTLSANSLFYNIPEGRSAQEMAQPTTPDEFPPLTREKRKKIAKELDKYLKNPTISDQMAQLCVYRSHNKFLNKLAYVIERFNEYVFSLSEEEREFVLVVPDAGSPKSNHWATGLSLPYLRVKPTAIVESGHLSEFYRDHPSIKHAVYIDDAVYSGRQMDEMLSSSGTSLRKIVIAPYYKYYNRLPKDTLLIAAEEMLVARRMIKDADSLIDRKCHGKWDPVSSKSGTIFNHKAADEASIFYSDFEIEPDSILSDGKKQILPPYK